MTSPSIMKQVAELRGALERLLNEDDAMLKEALLGAETGALAAEAKLTAEQFINTELVFLARDCQELQGRMWAWNPSWTGVSAVRFGLPPHPTSGRVAEENVTRCSFCNKSREQVKRLVSHRNSVFICDECIDLCQEILHAPPGR